MQRKWKIVLGSFISIIILSGSAFAVILLLNNNDDEIRNEDDPVLLFPVENTEVLVMLYGFVWDNISEEFIHEGIDFIVNDTATIIASTNMTCNDKGLYFNEGGGFWQAGCSFDINDAFELLIAFESFTTNETEGNIMLDNIFVEIGQEVTAGEVIGNLLYYGPGDHIHYALMKNNELVCPYPYFSNESKVIFDNLWAQIGLGTDPCNSTNLSFF